MFLENKPISINAIKKTKYSGSYQGMRYMLEKSDDLLKTYVYPEPFCYESTNPENITSCEFEFSEEGYDLAIKWLNEQYESHSEYWNKALANAMNF